VVAVKREGGRKREEVQLGFSFHSRQSIPCLVQRAEINCRISKVEGGLGPGSYDRLSEDVKKYSLF